MSNPVANPNTLTTTMKSDERVKERLTGSFSYYSCIWPSLEGETVGFAFKGFTDNKGNLPIDKLDDAGKFLASQLEKYLNGEIE